jgi:hypothetical protein
MKRYVYVNLLVLLTIVISGFTYEFDTFDVRYKQGARSISETAVRGIVEEALATQLETEDYYRASVRVYSVNNSVADFLAVYFYKRESLLLECYKIDLDDQGKAVSVTGDFREPYNEEDEKPCGNCPDPSVEVYVETAMDGVPAGAATWCANEASNAGYKTVLDLAAAATAQKFKDYLSCPKLVSAIHVGHGNTWVIAFASEIITNEWFETLPPDYLREQTHMYGSCLAHNDPLEASILGAGAEAFMSGDVELNIQYLQNTMFSISRPMFNGTDVETAFNGSDARSRGWGISGNPPGGPWFIEVSTPIRTGNKPFARDNLSLHYGNQCISVTYTVNNGHNAQGNNARLDVYTISGKLVKTLIDEPAMAGKYSVKWNVADQANGIYLFKLYTGGNVTVKRYLISK